MTLADHNHRDDAAAGTVLEAELVDLSTRRQKTTQDNTAIAVASVAPAAVDATEKVAAAPANDDAADSDTERADFLDPDGEHRLRLQAGENREWVVFYACNALSEPGDASGPSRGLVVNWLAILTGENHPAKKVGESVTVWRAWAKARLAGDPVPTDKVKALQLERLEELAWVWDLPVHSPLPPWLTDALNHAPPRTVGRTASRDAIASPAQAQAKPVQSAHSVALALPANDFSGTPPPGAENHDPVREAVVTAVHATEDGAIKGDTVEGLRKEQETKNAIKDLKAAQTILGMRRREDLRTAKAEMRAERRAKRTVRRIAARKASDEQAKLKADAAAARASSTTTQIAQVHRWSSYTSFALLGVIVAGFFWSAVNAQSNLTAGAQGMSDSLRYLSYLVDAMVSVPIVVIMVVFAMGARTRTKVERGWIILGELGLIAVAIGLNAGPYLSAGDFVGTATHALPPAMISVVVWLQSWASKWFGTMADDLNAKAEREKAQLAAARSSKRKP